MPIPWLIAGGIGLAKGAYSAYDAEQKRKSQKR